MSSSSSSSSSPPPHVVTPTAGAGLSVSQHRPPISAFQSLPLSLSLATQQRSRKSNSKRNRQSPKQHLHHGPAKVTPIDPIEALLIENATTTATVTTETYAEEDSSVASDLSSCATATNYSQHKTSAFDELHKNWSESPAMALYEKSCLASFVVVFHKSDPPLAVVMGLWSQIVLPPILANTKKLPQLVAQDVLTTLKTKLQYFELAPTGRLSVSREIYTDFGKELATDLENQHWELPLLMYLKDAYNDNTASPQLQMEILQHYAACELIGRLLNLGQVKEAGMLLHHSSFSKRLAEYLKEENLSQLTRRMTKWLEQYLRLLPPTQQVWQEALTLYQGWFRTLEQEWTIDPRKSKRPPDAVTFLVLGRAMYTLSMSLDKILVEQPTADPYMKVLWVRQCGYLVKSIQLLQNVNNDEHPVALILSSATWIALGETCATLNLCGMEHNIYVLNLSIDDEEQGDDEHVKCLKMALALLKKVPLNKSAPSLQTYFSTLWAEAKECLGRWLYDRRQYEAAILPLDEAIKAKRQILVKLKEAVTPTSSTLFQWTRPTINALRLPVQAHDDDLEDLRNYLYSKQANDGTGQQIEDVEIGLSVSLEYSALALHATGKSVEAIAGLQEALILKITHFGKLSLEVARLNVAMAVVHEDLEQWDAVLARCRECVRIRMHHLSQYSPSEWFSEHDEVFRGMLENLRSMGNSHRMLGDHDNAIGCYWKIATMSRKEWEILRDGPEVNTVFCGFDNHALMFQNFRVKLPLPALVLEEERYHKPGIASPDKSLLERPESFTLQATDDENVVLREAAQAYQTIMSIFKDMSAALKKEGVTTLASSLSVEYIPVLLAASCQLGFIHIHFGDYRSAISSLENCLHSLWILDPISSESSGSDSYDSQSDCETKHHRKAKNRKTRILQGVFGQTAEIVDDELVYHALGVCRAACGEFYQAVRFHVTALRYAQSVHGVNSLQASAILYDAATSYWYMQEYEKASEFWESSAQIRNRISEEQEKMNHPEQRNVDKIGSDDTVSDKMDLAKITYNIGACYCAMGRYDNPRTSEALEYSMECFGEHESFQIAKAGCLFYMAVGNFRRANKSRDSSLIQVASDNLERAVCIYRSHGYLTPDKHNLPFQALQAHVRFMHGRITCDQGKLKEALASFTIALDLYRSLSKEWHVYVASVLNEMGRLHMKLLEDDLALIRFGECLTIRRAYLGRDHDAVGSTLYHMADIYARLDQFDISMEMYNEALRIQLQTEGNDSAAVAMNLLKMGALFARQGLLNDSLEKLNGALRIRKDRALRLGMASRVVPNVDVAEDYFTQVNNKAQETNKNANNSDEQDQVRKALHQEAIKEEIALAVVYHCMGNVYVKQNDFVQAKDSFQNALLVRRRHPVKFVMAAEGYIKLHAADTLHNLGCIYELEGDYDTALKYYAMSLKLKHEYKVPVTTTTKIDPVVTSLPKEDASELMLYNGVLSLDGRYLEFPGTLSYAATLHRIGSIHYRLENCSVAAACFHAACDIQRQRLGNDHFILARTLSDMGNALRSVEGRRSEALECYRESIRIRGRPTNALGAAADNVVMLWRMGNLHDLDRDYSRAVTCYRQAIEIFGRRYVNAVGRRVCQYVLSGRTTPSYNEGVDIDEVEKESFANNIFKMEAIPPTRPIDDDSAARFINVGTLASAMFRAFQKQHQDGLSDNSVQLDLDLNAPDCWISLELYLLSLAKLMNSIANDWRTQAGMGMREALQTLERGGKNSVVRGQDAVTFQMLYLIQE